MPTVDDLQQHKLQAEIDKNFQEARKARLEADDLERELKWKSVLSGAGPNSLVFPFDGEVGSDSVRYTIDTLSLWSRRHPGAKIQIIFNSPGGIVFDGLALYDFIIELREQGHPIETISIGRSASMAGILLQAGTKRVVGKHSWMLIHEISFGARGKTKQMEDDIKFTKRLQEKLLDILSERSNVSRDEIAEKWENHDWWLDAEEMVELGFADEVRAG